MTLIVRVPHGGGIWLAGTSVQAEKSGTGHRFIIDAPDYVRVSRLNDSHDAERPWLFQLQRRCGPSSGSHWVDIGRATGDFEKAKELLGEDGVWRVVDAATGLEVRIQ